MTTFLSTLGWGLAALLTVAVAVALWEYRQAKSSRPVTPKLTQPRQATRVDVDLDRVPASPVAPMGDQAERAEALDSALGRMGTSPATGRRPSGRAWTETQPMVAASLQVELPAEPPRA